MWRGRTTADELEREKQMLTTLVYNLTECVNLKPQS